MHLGMINFSFTQQKESEMGLLEALSSPCRVFDLGQFVAVSVNNGEASTALEIIQRNGRSDVP